eukprot:Gb_33827 [translate_table: standard]
MACEMKGSMLSLVFLAVMLAAKANAAGECGSTTAESAALRLAPCIQAGQNANAAVSSGCCNEVKKYATDPACLCAIMLSKTAKSVGINPAIAMSIPKRCQLSNRPVGYKCGAYTLP